MKPMIFKTESELASFISRLPVSDKTVKVAGQFEGRRVGGAEILGKITSLVPRMFELRSTLVKGRGGLGNLKSLERYCDIASENISDEAIAANKVALDAVNAEVERLIEGGLNNEIAEQVSRVKTQIAAFDMIREIITAFNGRIQGLVARCGSQLETLTNGLALAKRQARSPEGKSAIQAAHDDYMALRQNVSDLGQDLEEYCNLQIAYNSSLL